MKEQIKRELDRNDDVMEIVKQLFVFDLSFHQNAETGTK